MFWLLFFRGSLQQLSCGMGLITPKIKSDKSVNFSLSVVLQLGRKSMFLAMTAVTPIWIKQECFNLQMKNELDAEIFISVWTKCMWRDGNFLVLNRIKRRKKTLLFFGFSLFSWFHNYIKHILLNHVFFNNNTCPKAVYK